MGPVDSVPVDGKVGDPSRNIGPVDPTGAGRRSFDELIVVLFAAIIFLGCILSPPSLMDDVDAVQAQIARTMLQSGDWVTPHLDGIAYLEKSPLKYWMMAVSFAIFGVRDWAGRIPLALSAIALCWITMRFGAWAFGRRAGFYAGLALATCVGLFLFTRFQIPDATLTLTVTVALWSLIRALEDDEPHPARWAYAMWTSIGIGLLLKGLIAAVFPIAAGVLYLFFAKRDWRGLRPVSGLALLLAIAAPWHILATFRNPPYFDFSMHSEAGSYHGFFWFYFINEQVLRFLNLRYPRDYNTVPRLYFWAFHLLWLFPWSVYFPAVAKLSYKPVDRAGRTRLLAVCWAGFLLVFFTFSTTQEYYSMPCYPALCLLLGSAMAANGVWVKRGTRILTAVSAAAASAAAVILVLVRNIPTPGDISTALTQRVQFYTLALSHMEDLNLRAFAYLRLPLALAAIGFLIAALGTVRAPAARAFAAASLMMVVFFHAARLAMVTFDPYMSSRPLAEALDHAPRGTLIVDHHYYTFSSVFFYTNRDALLLNGRFNNLEYGAYAPEAPPVFVDDSQFKQLWERPERTYLVAKDSVLPRLEKLVGDQQINLLAESGGKSVISNHPLANVSSGF